MNANAQSIASNQPVPATAVSAKEHTPRSVAQAGARFVPQTLRYLGVPEGALHDAAQDVFVVALRRLDDFAGRSSLTTWLYGICIRVAHDYRRRERGRREYLVEELPEITAPAEQEAAVSQGEWRRALNSILDTLQEDQRAAFVLYEIQRLSMKEVADAIGCALATAYLHHKNARERVVAAYQRYSEEDGT